MAKRDGFEPVDDRPVAVPVQFRGPQGEVDRMREMMASLVRDLRGHQEVESFEESLDFVVDDDDDEPISNSETRYMKEERLLTEAEEAAKVVEQRRAAAQYLERVHGKDRSRRERVDGRGEKDGDRRGVEPAGDAGKGVAEREASGGSAEDLRRRDRANEGSAS